MTDARAVDDAGGGSVPRPAPIDPLMLRTPVEFTRCLGRPPLYRSGAFALHFARVVPGDPLARAPVWRLGLVIPKRHEKSAVARNTIKRRWRAAFRQGRAGWSGEFGSADLVVRLQGPLRPGSLAIDLALVGKPAKRRARALFDPQAMLATLAERLRRGGSPKATPRSAATTGRADRTAP